LGTKLPVHVMISPRSDYFDDIGPWHLFELRAGLIYRVDEKKLLKV